MLRSRIARNYNKSTKSLNVETIFRQVSVSIWNQLNQTKYENKVHILLTFQILRLCLEQQSYLNNYFRCGFIAEHPGVVVRRLGLVHENENTQASSDITIESQHTYLLLATSPHFTLHWILRNVVWCCSLWQMQERQVRQTPARHMSPAPKTIKNHWFLIGFSDIAISLWFFNDSENLTPEMII